MVKVIRTTVIHRSFIEVVVPIDSVLLTEVFTEGQSNHGDRSVRGGGAIFYFF